MKKHFPTIMLALVAIILAAGLFELFRLRFAEGDVYPEYSSLRADPLGTMAFCESLEKIPGLTVRRDFSATDQLPEGKDTTYLHLAASTFEWKSMPEELLKEVEGFMTRGGRLAITCFPETTKPWRFLDEHNSIEKDKSEKSKSKTNKKTEPSKSAKKKKKQLKPDEELVGRIISLKERWGLEFGFAALKEGQGDAYEPEIVLNKSDLALPERLEWHSGTIFTNLDQKWRIIYARGTNAVLIERKWGAGSIAIATDSYFLSNEAMRNDRHPDLLAWLVGPSKNVVFDESHFGIVESSGVATLIRKYRLHGLFAGLILLAGLFIWKNSVSFVPLWPEAQQQVYVAGKEAAVGFINLLRRNIQSQDVLKVCFEEWKKSSTRAGKYSSVRMEQARALFEADQARPSRERDSLRTYQEICRALKTPRV
jgi:hypothetical protein